MPIPVRAALAGWLLAAAASGVAAQHDLLAPTDLEDFGFFGETLAVDGERAAIAAPFAEGLGSNSGEVHVFRRAAGGWVEEARLVASDGPFNGLIGTSVALHGDLVAAGSREGLGTSAHYGSAYVFRRTPTGWVQEAKLTGPVPLYSSEFGEAVAAGPDEVVVGRPGPIGTQGAVHVFRRLAGTWTLTQTLLPLAASGYARFGSELSLSGDRLAVSAPGEDLGGLQATGSVSVYRRVAGGPWELEVRLFAPDAAAWDGFGTSVCLDGDRLAVGAPFDDDVINSSGAVHLFVRRRETWLAWDKLVPTDVQPDDIFGRSVDLVDDLLVAGARNPQAPGLPVETGSLYVYRQVGPDWIEERKIVPPALPSDTDFGVDVALHHRSVLVGAPRDSFVGPMAGQTHAFVLP